jgi:3-oxoacyl-[acyl-carrier-protein] synthase II
MESRSTEIKKVWIVDTNVVTALGESLNDTWEGVVRADTGIREIKRFPVERYYSRVAACVEGLHAPNDRSMVHPLLEILFKGMRPVPSDAALITATTKMGIDNLEKLRRKEAVHAGDILLSSLTEAVSQKVGLKGKGINVSASCASSTIAVAQGASLVASGMAEAVLVCCVDIVTEFTFSGFSALKVISASPCKPFDRSRSGLSLGDGAAALLLMSEERAARDGRSCVASILGWGASNDAFHIISPAQDGCGLVAAIDKALARAGLKEQDIRAVSAHGTATIYNDLMELTAFRRVFGGRKIPVYSVKGSIGHTTGAAGGIEVALAAKALAMRTVPPTAGFKDPEDGAEDLVSAAPVALRGDHCLTTNSGFGGINAAIVLERGGDT